MRIHAVVKAEAGSAVVNVTAVEAATVKLQQGFLYKMNFSRALDAFIAAKTV